MVWYWYSTPTRDSTSGEADGRASGKRVALQVGSGSAARLGARSRAAGCPIPYQRLTVEQVGMPEERQGFFTRLPAIPLGSPVLRKALLCDTHAPAPP